MADNLRVAEEVSRNFAVIENANPSLVKNAEGQVFISDQFGGQLVNAVVKLKSNAKLPKRFAEQEYSEQDNTAQPDRNPFSVEIKAKNDKARSLIFPLLNPMQKQQGIRLNAIELEITRDLATEAAKPEPDPKVIEQLKNAKTQIEKKKLVGDDGREGIVFKPRVDGENVSEFIKRDSE